MAGKLSVGIIDYGMGNTRSVANALAAVGVVPVVGGDRRLLKAADALILPGVGAFDAAMANLARRRLDDPLRNWIFAGKPFLGICLGMQLLAEDSEEGAHCSGLGVIPGRVVALSPDADLRIPHVGWNSIVSSGDRLFAGVRSGADFYFDHSYHLLCDPALACAHFNYGGRSVAAIRSGALFGTQFHPEKSQRHGLALLRNFVAEAGATRPLQAHREQVLVEAAFA